MLISLHREIETGSLVKTTIVGSQLFQHRRVIFGIYHHSNEAMILRRRTQHGGAADINILDGSGKIAGWICHGCLEWIEVHYHQIDGWNPMLRHHVLILVAPSEYAAMHFWVQGLYPAVHHLRKCGVV